MGPEIGLCRCRLPPPSLWSWFFFRVRPDDARKHLVSVTQIELVQLSAAVIRRPDQLTPLGRSQLDRIVGVRIGQRRWHFTFPRPALHCLADSGCCVKMRVNQIQLVVVMLVGILVCARVVRVVHARPQVCIIERLVLVIEAEGVADFLAHHQVSPWGGIVVGGVEVGVVELNSTLRDVAATNPDLSQAEPAVVPVLFTADLHATASWLTRPGFGPARDDHGVQYSRQAPATFRSIGRGG